MYGCETWTIYSRQEKRLNSFHLRCLRKLLNIKWQDKVTNTEVLEKANLPSIQTIIRTKRLRWLGHVKRMDDNRMPKNVLYGELSDGCRPRGRPKLRYKDLCKTSLKEFGIDEKGWETRTENKELWRRDLKRGARKYEDNQRVKHEEKRQRRKLAATTTPQTFLSCSYCGRLCKSNIGRISHERSCSTTDS